MPHWTIKIIGYGEEDIWDGEALDLAAAVQLALDAQGIGPNDEGSYTLEISGG